MSANSHCTRKQQNTPVKQNTHAEQPVVERQETIAANLEKLKIQRAETANLCVGFFG